jgi:hypothetical protein
MGLALEPRASDLGRGLGEVAGGPLNRAHGAAMRRPPGRIDRSADAACRSPTAVRASIF